MEPTEDDPAPQHTHAVTIICEECGELIELHNVEAFLLGQHQATTCPATAELRPAG